MSRPLSEIAGEIRADYAGKGKFVPGPAEPYIAAMESLSGIEDNYYADSGESVVRYALSNLSTWRGEKAKEIKAELKALLPENQGKTSKKK